MDKPAKEAGDIPSLNVFSFTNVIARKKKLKINYESNDIKEAKDSQLSNHYPHHIDRMIQGSPLKEFNL